MRHLNRRRILALHASLLILVAACSSADSEPTVPSTVAATTTTTSTSSTTTTVPLIPNGPAIAFEGDRNETVEAFQFLINCNGYAQLTVDGAFGPASLTAVETVQADLGREVTGAPDDETLALLSRSCSEDRRININDDDDGQQVVVGNAAVGDPEVYFIRADEGERLSVVLETEVPGATVDVRSADGTTLGVGGSVAFAADIESTGDFVIEIGGDDPVTFVATIGLGVLEFEDIATADSGSIVVDGLESTVSSACLDTAGEGSYVAEVALGHLVVTADRVGTYGFSNSGIGAPVEFVFRDGSPGYYGFSIDLDVEVDDQVEGTGAVFLRGAGNAATPLDVAFSFDRPVTPCDGTAGTSIVLLAGGLGVVDFGADPDETIETVRSAVVGASASVDTDWVTIDNLSNEFGVCRQGTTEARTVTIDNLTLFFSNAGTTFAEEGVRHFVGYTADEGVFPFKTVEGVGPGDSLGQVLAAHADAVAAPGLTGGVDAFITSPPGSDVWLRATAAEAAASTDTAAVVSSVTGGRFCDN
jgi:hypothetical protein